MSYIEIIYAPSKSKTIIKKIAHESDLTAWHAIEISGLLETYPEIINFAIGVYKNQVAKDYILRPKDRLEIYRPLLICPKEKRKALSKKR